MMRLFKFSLSLYVCTSFLSVNSLLAKNGVVVNQTMGHDGVSRDYYHLRHRLEIDNFTLITPSEWLQCHYCIVWKEPIDPKGCYHNRCYWDGSGNFIIYIKKDVFPIPSGCNSDWLKLGNENPTDQGAFTRPVRPRLLLPLNRSVSYGCRLSNCMRVGLSNWKWFLS